MPKCLINRESVDEASTAEFLPKDMDEFHDIADSIKNQLWAVLKQ